MLVIRLRRIGKKNKPSYRIVVAEHSFPIDGRFVEDLGYYNPHTKNTGLDKDKATNWMDKGAKPSNTVAKIMKTQKVKHKSVVVVKSAKKAKKSADNSDSKAEKPTAEAINKEVPVGSTETTDKPEETSKEEPKEEKSDS